MWETPGSPPEFSKDHCVGCPFGDTSHLPPQHQETNVDGSGAWRSQEGKATSVPPGDPHQWSQRPQERLCGQEPGLQLGGGGKGGRWGKWARSHLRPSVVIPFPAIITGLQGLLLKTRSTPKPQDLTPRPRVPHPCHHSIIPAPLSLPSPEPGLAEVQATVSIWPPREKLASPGVPQVRDLRGAAGKKQDWIA